jgi:transposase
MGNYRYIPDAQKQLILTMSLRGTATKEIATATGVSPRTISRILRLWKTTGQTAKHSLDKGRPRALTSLEVSVRCQIYRQHENGTKYWLVVPCKSR